VLYSFKLRPFAEIIDLAGERENEPKTFLGSVFNYKLGCSNDVHVLICEDTRPHPQL